MSEQTREGWLREAVEHLRGLFREKVQEEVPAGIHVSVGLGGGKATIGTCWKSAASEDKRNHIFISPALDSPVKVLATLVHELCHAIDDCENGHRNNFTRLARGVGLAGRLTATHAGDELQAYLEAVADQLGPYPHSRLNTMTTKGSSTPKQTTRMLKLVCHNWNGAGMKPNTCECGGYTVRTTRKWLEVGYPMCPAGTEMEEAIS